MADIKIRINGEEKFAYDESARKKIGATVNAVPGGAAAKSSLNKALESADAIRGGVGRMARSGLSFARNSVTQSAKHGLTSGRDAAFGADKMDLSLDAAKKAATGAIRQVERTREIARQTVAEAITPWLPTKAAPSHDSEA